MYLIFKRTNPCEVISFNSLDDIKEATKTGVYGKYNYDGTRINGSPNDYSDFTIISNPKFPYELCDNYSPMKNIILDTSNNPLLTYYLLDEHRFAHGDWTYPSIDKKKLIFDDLIKVKKYCKSVSENLSYMYFDNCDDPKQTDNELIDEKINELENHKKKNIVDFEFRIRNSEETFKRLLKEYEKDFNSISFEKFKLMGYKKEKCEINFDIGNDFFVNFTISKIKNSSYWE